MAKNKIVYFGTTLIDLTDTTAVASDVAQGKYFYTADGVKTVGTASGGGGGGGLYPWFGPNTVKDYSKTITINLANDTSWNDWTASTTAASILAAPTTNDISYSYDFTQYGIFVVFQAITSYKYNSGATKQAIPISSGRYYCYYEWGVPNNSHYYDGVIGTIQSNSVGAVVLMYYGTSGSKLGGTSNYGAYTNSTPSMSGTLSDNIRTIGGKRSTIYARCSNSYFATARKADIDAANTNIVITWDVYKTPINNLFAEQCENNLLTAMRACPENQ